MGMVAISVIWSTSVEQILSPDHKGAIWNLTLICPAAWEQMFESINLHDNGQRSNNDLDLWYSYVFMYSLYTKFEDNWPAGFGEEYL